MAYSVKPNDSGEVHAEKVVIVTGPSFGTAIKLILFGAALGAGAALYWKNQQNKTFQPTLPHLGEEKTAKDATVRLNNLADRAKALANRAKDVVQAAAEIAAPTVQHAFSEIRQAAKEAEAEIKEEIQELKAKDDKKDDKPEQV